MNIPDKSNDYLYTNNAWYNQQKNLRYQLDLSFNTLKCNWPQLYRFATTTQIRKHNKTIKELAYESYFTNPDLKPTAENLFNAFILKPNDIKVVILGQDPYPNDHAHGLSFSSLDSKVPASLKNIFKCLKYSYGEKFESIINIANLDPWVQQGVFLLNTRLTTIAHNSLSKSENYWIDFTKEVFKVLKEFNNIVYLIWGKKAEEYVKYIDCEKNLVLITSHPSPLSARHGFLTSNCFIKANNYLEQHNKKIIQW